MAWIKPGVLVAGTRPSAIPRIAEEELPGVDIALGGFYIDVLPYPNEPGALPTIHITQEESERLCRVRGKRLCTELEWERACKGPDNTQYEYGDVFREGVCAEPRRRGDAAKIPLGTRSACVSGFWVKEMHGGVREWTSSPFGRGDERGQVALRGGVDEDLRIGTRCARAFPMAKGKKSPEVGFRCCQGPENTQTVDLKVRMGPAFEHVSRSETPTPPVKHADEAACGPPTRPQPCILSAKWKWRPAGNVELYVAAGCVGKPRDARCGVVVTTEDSGGRVLTQVDAGREMPEVVLVAGEERHLRMRGGDASGPFFRELVYVFGAVDVRAAR